VSEAARERKGHRITSPAELHDYIHVTSPNLWILLTVIILMLAGLIILAATIPIENTMPVQVDVDVLPDGQPPMITCLLSDERKSNVKIGMKVRIAGEVGRVQELIENETQVLASIELDREDTRLKEGSYDAVIVLERTTAGSFIMSTDTE
jgi:hypothetical protein